MRREDAYGRGVGEHSILPPKAISAPARMSVRITAPPRSSGIRSFVVGRRTSAYETRAGTHPKRFQHGLDVVRSKMGAADHSPTTRRSMSMILPA